MLVLVGSFSTHHSDAEGGYGVMRTHDFLDEQTNPKPRASRFIDII